MVPTFQYPCHRASRLCFQPIVYAGLQLSAKMLSSYNRLIKGKRWKSQGAKSGVNDGRWSNTSHRKLFRSLFVAAAVCDRVLLWRKTIPVDNIPRSLLRIKESNCSMHSTFGRRLYSFRHVYKLTTHSELTSMMCCDHQVYERYSAIDICAKLHLILTVVLILQPIGSW